MKRLVWWPLILFLTCLSVYGREPAPNGRNVALVCSRAFAPAMQRWILYRQSQGYAVHTLVPPPRQAAPSFLSLGAALPDPESIREQLRRLNETAPLCAVLIVGDGAPLEGQSPDASDPLGSALNVIPAPRVPAKVIDRFGYEDHIASDNWYADFDGDSFPDVPIGRIPARTPRQAEDAVSKILYYEQVAPSGEWQRRVALIAGMPGFSPILDGVITNATRRILSKAIPAEYDWTLVQADWRSPYCPDPFLFRYTVLDELNKGPLFWVYMGHGLHQELDRLVTPAGNYKIMELDDLRHVNCGAGLPIMLFCACYTGAYDSTEMSIAEEFVLKPNGPIAAIASSRTSMPYGMGVFGIEFLDEVFRSSDEPGDRTLGEYIMAAKRRMKYVEKNAKGAAEKGASDENAGSADAQDTDGRSAFDEPAAEGDEPAPDSESAADASETDASRENAPSDGEFSPSDLRKTADRMARFFDPTAPRLGDQLEDHRYLFNLFGDPLLRIRFPKRIEFDSPETATQGETIVVSSGAAAPPAAEDWSAAESAPSAEPAHVRVELVTEATSPKIKFESRAEYSETDEARIEYQRTFEKVNDRVVVSAESDAADGAWSVELPLSVERSGMYIVRVLITSPEGTSAGAKPICVYSR